MQITSWHLEAVIASLHASAPSFDETPWIQIEGLYQKWLACEGENAMVRLQALTAAIYYSPQPKLKEELEALRASLGPNQVYLIDATMAVLFEKLGDLVKRNQSLERAIQLCKNSGDKKLLQKKLNW